MPRGAKPGKPQKSKKGNKNAKKPDGPIEYNPNKKARGHAPSSIQGPPTRAEEQEREYYNSVFKGHDFPIAAMPELNDDPLENTQFYLPRRKSSRYPTATYAPIMKNNPYLEATRGSTGYTDSDSYGRSFRYRDPVYDNTEREILEGMVTPPRTPSNASPTTPEILSAIKSLDTPKPSPKLSPPPPIYDPSVIDPDFGFGFDEIETPPPTPLSTPKKKKSKKNSKSAKKGGKKQCKTCKKYYTCKHNCCKRTTRKCKKRNTKKRGKY